MAAADVKPQEIQMEDIGLNEMKDNTKIKRKKGGEEYQQLPDTDVVDADTSNINTQHKNGGKKSVVKTLLKLLPIAVIVVLVVVLYAVTDARHQSTLQSLTSAISSKQGQAGVMLPFAAKQVGNTVQDTMQKYYLNIGKLNDNFIL
ncbi:hypothetical protein DPMN_175120 [Dreissena polymorpha]|uniref:Uncharacterized protein n=1 Tax=Dreissena polymorpha TaxID=45954 RepID=A0A9D4IIF7_DREPO|nr:hypothetical protein DPMN_175120 [Dreissena polymorpha]